MKKILTVSVLAMMAVTAANAEIASKAYVDQRETAANDYTDTKIGTLPGNAENVGAAIGNLGDSATVAAAIAAAVQNGTDNAVTHTGAVGSATQPVFVAADGTATASTSTVGGVSQPVYLNAGTITAGTALGTMAYEAAANYTPTADLGDLATLDEVGSAQITDGSVALGDLATGVQTSLGKADTALQAADVAGKADAATGLTAGTNTKITYNAQGIVTGGAALEATDIPTLTMAKISDAGDLATMSTVGTSEIDDGAVTLAKLSATLPTACQASGNKDCALVSHSGVLAWEQVERATNETALNTTTGTTGTSGN